MIYTSYFGKLQELEKNNLVPVAICGGIPDWYKGKWYRKLAPSWSIWSEYDKSKDSVRYTERFVDEILNKRDPKKCYQDLCELTGKTYAFVMLCYEKPNQFCHRHLVADWFNQHGIICREWESPEEF